MDLSYWYIVFGLSFMASMVGLDIVDKDLDKHIICVSVVIPLLFTGLTTIISALVFTIKLTIYVY